jgi:hypothetical protein
MQKFTPLLCRVSNKMSAFGLLLLLAYLLVAAAAAPGPCGPVVAPLLHPSRLAGDRVHRATRCSSFSRAAAVAADLPACAVLIVTKAAFW